MRAAFAAVLLVLLAGRAPAQVVINELLYHAPDDLDKLQFIELHNAGDKPVDLSGWKLARSVKYTFPGRTTLPAGGFLVVCKDQKEMKKHYGLDAAGAFDGALPRRRGEVELLDAAGKKVDAVSYGSRAPWPVAPDGYTSSLERICPTDATTGPENWAASPMSDRANKPGGTPGKNNATHAAHLPPAISRVTFTPANPTAEQTVKVEADVRSPHALDAVELRYRVAGTGYEKQEAAVRMASDAKGRYSATIPAQKAGQLIRFRVRAADAKKGERFYPHPNDVRPALTCYAHDKFKPDQAPFGLIINVSPPPLALRWYGSAPSATPPARGRAAFVWVDARTGTPRVFDFVSVTGRTGGRKVRFHKDRTLDGMSVVNIIYEHMDRFLIAESLAYEVYRKAGNAAPRSDIVRLWVDGRPIGLQLLVEQPNKAFLRHNRLRADGNLYKVVWFGQGLVGQHEKKTNAHGGHGDLIELVAALNKAKGDAQWALIKKHFDVEQVINYFAVNMVLSHWDGYFNNHFSYHDVNGSGKWTMYPWDQDKTWGYHDGIRGDDVFTDMPLTFGMAGDRPPGGFGAIWWRGPGAFSGPLLANPTFRKHFLARVKELAEKVYTEEAFGPVIKRLGERLEGEVKSRAALQRRDEKAALARLAKDLDVMRDHLKKRRKWLLEQPEIKAAGKFERKELK